MRLNKMVYSEECDLIRNGYYKEVGRDRIKISALDTTWCKILNSQGTDGVGEWVAGIMAGPELDPKDKMEPILVEKTKDGLALIDGHHRFGAIHLWMKNRNIDDVIIPVRYVEKITKISKPLTHN